MQKLAKIDYQALYLLAHLHQDFELTSWLHAHKAEFNDIYQQLLLQSLATYASEGQET